MIVQNYLLRYVEERPLPGLCLHHTWCSLVLSETSFKNRMTSGPTPACKAVMPAWWICIDLSHYSTLRCVIRHLNWGHSSMSEVNLFHTRKEMLLPFIQRKPVKQHEAQRMLTISIAGSFIVSEFLYMKNAARTLRE